MPTFKVQSASQTYANELALLGYGIALWEPAPLHNYEKVTIGDVGYIRDGCFHLLFSTSIPLRNRVLGVDVPRDFVHLNPGPTFHKQPRAPGSLHRGNIDQKGAMFGASSDISFIPAGTNVRYESSSETGAILLTKAKTYRTDVESLGYLKNYMARNYQSWLEYANQRGHMVNLEDILLVTGHDMTQDFAMLAFSSNSRHMEMEFEAGFPGVASASASVWGTWRTTMSVHHNCGPQHREPPSHNDSRALPSTENPLHDDSRSEYSQCVFLRGFRTRRRAGLFPKVIKAAAGPHDLGSGHRYDEEGPQVLSKDDENSDVEIISDIPTFIDPLDLIFRYIFENSNAKVAILHDLDLCSLIKATGTSIQDDIGIMISRLTPELIKLGSDGIACINAEEGEALPTGLIPDLDLSKKIQYAPQSIIDDDPGGDKSGVTSAWTLDRVETSPEESKAKATGMDRATYHAEQDKLKAEIDALQVKMAAVKDKISLTSKNGPGNDRRMALRAELDTLRTQQSSGKTSRSKLFDQLKQIQDGIQKKVKDLQAARTKASYKTVAEVDAQVKHLDKQVESGNLKIAEEKRALAEISQLKRSRKTVEGFQAEQEAIEADRARADELRKQLDDPEAKAVSDRFDAIRAELDELKKEGDEAYAGRNKLFDERNALQAELDTLWTRKRESSQRYREAGDKYYQKVSEDRARRAEKFKAQRAAEEEEKRREVKERLLEEAKTPAFQAKIEDCQTLIDYFAAKIAGGSAPAPALTSLSTASKPEVAGVPKLELRQVDQDAGKGLVARKKKGEDEENYFVGGKGKGKKGSKSGSAANTATGPSSSSLNIPFATLSALLELSIPPPASTSDLPRAIEDLKTKKAWFEANRDRVTAEHIARFE